MTRALFAALAGALFAVGLAVSGMTRPEKVVGFLDLAGAWDASLAFVMAGAIGVHFVAQRIARRWAAPLLETRFHLPPGKRVDARLLAGAALFGAGWGIGGFCPGPGLVAAAGGGTAAVLFVIGMTGGMVLESMLARRALTTAAKDRARAFDARA